MASEYVIELGSSDDEPEPPPKRQKPLPNAMVHIPRKLHDVTIKPAKRNTAPAQKQTPDKALVVKKLPMVVNSFTVNKNKLNGKQGSMPVLKTYSRESHKPPLIQNKPAINPLSFMNKLNNRQIQINKVQSSYCFKAIKIQKTKSINLPSSITITRTAAGPKHNELGNTIGAKRKKPHMVKNNIVNEVLMVDDDDEVAVPSTASPQWYLRPEEQTELSKLEEENNKEPEPTKFIEITIEDSPIKTLQNKTCEIGTELAITIDDSPAKILSEKNNAVSDRDEDKTSSKKDPKSKKSLQYPKDTKTVEIEIEPLIPIITNKQEENQEGNDQVSKTNEVFEIQESPLKKSKSDEVEHNNQPNTEIKAKNSEVKSDNDAKDSEFHPVYQSFIDLCFKLEDSDDMKKIVDKKIKAYYKQVPKDYTESEVFIEMISSKITSMKASPEKMYLYIKDIVDELNLQRKIAKMHVLNKEKTKETEKFSFAEHSEYDSKRQRQIRKLEKTIKKLHRAIQKLEEQEVDFDDDEDSVYLLTESEEDDSSKKFKSLLQRYKERMVRVYAKFCQLTNTKMPSEPRIHIEARPGRPSGPAKRLEKWINRKVPIGTPLPFPDFHDVLRCVREGNEDDKLGWNEADIMEEARDLFTRCGKKLQRRRQENEWRLAASRLSEELDPAEKSDDLKKKLDENKQLAVTKETEVLNKYADRQYQLKLEAEEIGDVEADESPEESDDEPTEEKNSLENKNKRKQRLRRLLQEKSKKNISIEEKNDDTNQTNDINNKNSSEDVKEIKELEKSQEVKMDVDSNEKNEISEDVKNVSAANEDKNSNCSEKVLSLSDDSNKIESDIDELHLLQKLHSENEINTSTVESSGTDTPIAISDTLESSSDVESKEKPSCDVISIENSSYSETETKDNDDLNKYENIVESKNDTVEVKHKQDALLVERKQLENEYIEVQNKDITGEKPNLTESTSRMESSVSTTEKNENYKPDKEEYNESIENELLASSDDESNANKNDYSRPEEPCINLQDDDISIGETIVENTSSTNRSNPEEHSLDKATSSEKNVMDVLIDNKTEHDIKGSNQKLSHSDIVNKSNDTIDVEDQNDSKKHLKSEDTSIKELELKETLESNDCVKESVNTADQI